MKRLVLLLINVILPLSLQAQDDIYWKAIDSRPVPAWFEDAKFGIFIHWGLYSVPSYSPSQQEGIDVHDRYAEHYWRRLLQDNYDRHFFQEFHNRVYGENYRYEDFASDFKAEMFQPDRWAGILEGSGAKYVVLTSKHHEGWCLWPSDYSRNWNAVDTGPHRDLLGDLTKAVRSRGLKMGYYYSLLEWFNPLYKAETLDEYIDTHMHPQMKELVTEYEPDVLWTDGEWDYTSAQWRSTQFLTWLFNESPVKDRVVVNDRWGKDTRSRHGGFFTTEYDMAPSFGGGDVDAGGIKFTRPWEECRGISASFGFNRNEYLDEYSTSGELVHMLINKISRGGNLLLNIGPTADGRIPLIMQQRLSDMGEWLRVNGEAVYGSRKWEGAPPVTSESKVMFTTKPGVLYVFVTEWTDEPIIIENVGRVKSVEMLGYKGNIRWTQTTLRLVITPAQIKLPSDIPCKYAWVYKVVF